MIEFKENTPTVAQIYQYTYYNKKLRSRFKNEKRDILISKLRIQERIVYSKNKEGKFTTPDERLFVYSESAPQYYPYLKVKSSKAKRQMKIKHHYDITICIQKTDEGEYEFFKSKMVWRVGSLKKYPTYIPQSKVKTIHTDTKEKIKKRYSKLPLDKQKIAVKKEFDKIRKTAKYLSDGDYVSRVYGINGDAYFRDYPIQEKFNCLYGKCYHKILPKGINFPFADKHLIAVLKFLMQKQVLKYK